MAGGGAVAQDAGSEPQAGFQIEDVVVTAQRRSETAQKTALSITAVGGETLVQAGVTNPDDITRVVPGVQVSGGTTTQIYVRGIGDYGVTAQANPAIVTNIDGVVVSRPQAFSGNLFDIERVEVLKGPQGTLYGRNASGGVLNVLTVQPKLNEYSGYFDATFGNYSQVGGEGAFNLPLGDTAALRLSYQLNRRDGYLSDGSEDDDREAVRLQVRTAPNERLSLTGSLSYTHLGGVGSGIVPIPAIPGMSPWSGITDPRVSAVFQDIVNQTYVQSGGQSVPPFLIDPLSDSPLFRDVKSWAASAHLEYDLGFATLTVIPAWRETDAQLSYNFNYHYNLGAPYNAAGDRPDGENSTQTSLEVRLGNETDRVKWVLGGFLFAEDQTTDYQLRAGAILNTLNKMSLKTDSAAVFGQATYDLTDRFRVTGGLRYTSDTRKAFDFERYAISPMMLGMAPSPMDCTPPNGAMPGTLCPIYNPTPGFYDSEKTFNEVTGKVGVEYDLASASLLYADISRGFKAGGFNQSVALVTRDALMPFEPEEIISYTIGVKNRFLENRLQLNGELFYYDYTNMQLSNPGFDGDNSVVLVTGNAAGATIKGASVDMVAMPWQGGTIRASVEYVDGVYDNFQVQQPANFVPPGRIGCPVSPPTPQGVVNIDCSGFPLLRSPKWSGALGITQYVDLNNGDSLVFNADVAWADKAWLMPDFHPNQQADAYANVSASVTYNFPNDRWHVALWGRNLTDEAIYTGGGGLQHGFVTGWTTSSIAPPRTYGVRLGARF
ncbi:TonB-dependent receptor [Brevundimonas guildfordensis]|uniref:TonB-dependent receptor n=1 Tax=Brevundimonas guildfordensis TaxID=2762241 RepID=A0ABR8QWN4_9CAUL|nr:TonB-dependent receptor [Brevundimonas guildfordensis]MBD7939947.1 TonB-dependent receptor [Brevundimonas guildfordensis]